MKQVFPRDSANILMALCTLFMYSCTIASHSTGTQGTTTVKVYVHDTTRIISSYEIHDTVKAWVHDTLRLIIANPVHDTVIVQALVRDTLLKPYVIFIHDTIIKPAVHDTIVIHDSTPAPVIKKDSSSKTLYLRDLGIVPNTGECLTDKLLQVINKAVATGGKTTLVFSDEGEYRLLNGTDFLKGLAPTVVTFKYDCYPNDIKSPLGTITIKPCK